MSKKRFFLKFLRIRILFTLLELLITIAIISILACLLLSALKQTQNATKKITCINNLKQWGICFSMYVADSNDFFPLSKDLRTSTRYWDKMIEDIVGRQALTGIKKCPNGTNEVSAYAGTNSYGMSYTWGYKNATYDLNSQKLAKIPQPAYLILITDSPAGPDFSPWYSAWLTSFPVKRHQNTYNLLFTDGHAVNIKCGAFGLYGGAIDMWPRDDLRWIQWKLQ